MGKFTCLLAGFIGYRLANHVAMFNIYYRSGVWKLVLVKKCKLPKLIILNNLQGLHHAIQTT